MDVDVAFYRVCHEFPGGVPALAAVAGLNANTLQAKADPKLDRPRPTLKESILCQKLTGNHHVLHAMAQQLGEVCIPLPDHAQIGDMAVLEAVTAAAKEFGDVLTAVNRSVADGKVTRDEVDNVKQQAYELAQAVFGLLHRLEAIAE